MVLRAFGVAIGLLAVGFAAAAAAPKPPGFMSLRTDEANGRRGPAPDQPVVWVYQARGLPVNVLAASGEYFQISDPDGDKAWIHKSQLSPKRTVYVSPADGPLALQRGPRAGGRPVAMLEPRVIATLDACEGKWRKISVAGHTGWADAEALFGAKDCTGVEAP